MQWYCIFPQQMHYQTFGNHSCSSAVYFYWALHQRCPYWELFWSKFSRIQTEYEQIRMPENADQSNSDHGHFLRNGDVQVSFFSSYRLSRHSSLCTFPLSNHSLCILSDGVAYHQSWVNWWYTDVTGFPFHWCCQIDNRCSSFFWHLIWD